MDDRREREMIQTAVDTTLSGLQGNPYRVQLVLRAAQRKGEKQPVKRKWSVALVVALALALTTVTALAVGLTNYFAGYKALESRYGDLEDWPASAQVELVQVMLDSGVLSLDDVPGWQELKGPEKEAAAQAAVDNYFGDMIFVDTYNIMARILGPIEQWTDEQRAMYTELLVQYGEQKADGPYYMVPAGSDLTREQALQKARAYLADIFGLDMDYLNSLPTSAYFYASAYNDEGLPDDEPFWGICIGEGEAWQYRHYVNMTRTGELLSLSMPGSGSVRAADLTADVMEGAEPAEPGENTVTAEEAIASARSSLTEIGNRTLSYEEVGALTGEATLIQSDRYMRGQEPVWLVNWYRDGALVYHVLLTQDGQHIDWQAADMAFICTER